MSKSAAFSNAAHGSGADLELTAIGMSDTDQKHKKKDVIIC